MTLGIYTRQLLTVTSIVFDKILSAITVRLRTFPFSISIILTSFSHGTLAVVITSVPYSTSLLSYLL
jgi:hypothetical protein